MNTEFNTSKELAVALNQADALHDFKNRFYFPQHQNQDAIYFCGNSLGLQPKTFEAAFKQEMEDWR
jgi:kynureninase